MRNKFEKIFGDKTSAEIQHCYIKTTYKELQLGKLVNLAISLLEVNGVKSEEIVMRLNIM